MTQLIDVPVTKAKQTIQLDIDGCPPEVFSYMVLLGAKTLINRGMTKITKEAFPDPAQLIAEAMAVAQKQVDAIMAGEIRFTGAKRPKPASGEIMTEARRLARALVKEEMKRTGLKISHYKASEITKVANELIDSSPEILEQAKANVEARKQAKLPTAIDLKKAMQEDPELVAKAEEKKVATLSAAKAGKVKGKARPQAQA